MAEESNWWDDDVVTAENPNEQTEEAPGKRENVDQSENVDQPAAAAAETVIQPNGDNLLLDFGTTSHEVPQRAEAQPDLLLDFDAGSSWKENVQLEDADVLLENAIEDDQESAPTGGDDALLDLGIESESEKRDEQEDRPKMRKMQSVVEPAAPPSAEAKSEAQLIIEAKQRKREEEDMEELQALEEKRRAEREREEEELRRLKEKQAERKKAREEEERRLEEQKQLAEEQRRKDEDARRQKAEDEKQRKKEEAERKKAAAAASASGGRNFVIDKERSGESGVDKFMNISKAKTEMSLNAGELQDLRQKTINDRVKPLSVSELDHNGLKSKAEDLWKTIIKLETTNYDLGERFKRQEYDLKELNERQRQISHKKHLAQGLDPEAASSRYPPKVQLASKYERRVDRRTFEERKNLFEQNGVDDKPKELVKPLAKKREDWIKPKETKSHRETPADDFENEHAENDEMEKNSVVHVDDESFEQQKVNSQNSQEHDQDDWTEPDLAEEAQENHIAVASNSRKSSGIVSQTESERDINDENVNEDDLFAGKEDYTALATTTEA